MPPTLGSHAGEHAAGPETRFMALARTHRARRLGPVRRTGRAHPPKPVGDAVHVDVNADAMGSIDGGRHQPSMQDPAAANG